MKKTMIFFSVMLMVFMIITGFAKNHGSFYGNACENLTQDQWQRLEHLHQKFIDETVEERAELSSAWAKMKMIMQTSESDTAELETLSSTVADLQKKVRDQQISFLLEAKKIAPEFPWYHFMGKDWNGGEFHGLKMHGKKMYHHKNEQTCPLTQ